MIQRSTPSLRDVRTLGTHPSKLACCKKSSNKRVLTQASEAYVPAFAALSDMSATADLDVHQLAGDYDMLF